MSTHDEPPVKVAPFSSGRVEERGKYNAKRLSQALSISKLN